jgi:hypothetical protein
LNTTPNFAKPDNKESPVRHATQSFLSLALLFALVPNPAEAGRLSGMLKDLTKVEPVCTPRFMHEIDEAQEKYDRFLLGAGELEAEDNVRETRSLSGALEGRMQRVIDTCASRSPADKAVLIDRYAVFESFAAEELERIRPSAMMVLRNISTNQSWDTDKKIQKMNSAEALKYFAERDETLRTQFNNAIESLNTDRERAAARFAEVTKYRQQLGPFNSTAEQVVYSIQRHESRIESGLDSTVDNMTTNNAKRCVTQAEAGLTQGVPGDAPVLVAGNVNEVRTLNEWRDFCDKATKDFAVIDVANQAARAKQIKADRAAFVKAYVKGPGQAQVNRQMKYRGPRVQNIGNKIRWVYSAKSSHALFANCEEFMFTSSGNLLSHRSYLCEE